MATIEQIDLISTDPQVRNGKPCIAGTGVRVTDIAIVHLYHRRSADEMSSDYGLTSGQVYAALAYYYEHKSTLDEEIRRQIRESQKLKEEGLGGSTSLLSG